MGTILSQLPQLSQLDGQLEPVVKKLVDIAGAADGFSLGDLAGLLNNAQSLALPTGADLIGGAMATLGKMAAAISASPDELTGALRKGLETLVTDTAGIGALLGPLASMMGKVRPFLEQTDAFIRAAGEVKKLIGTVGGRFAGLSLTGPASLLELFSRALAVFPGAASMAPFKDMRDQVETLKSWISSDAHALASVFSAQIGSLAESLHAQLDSAMEGGETQLAEIQAGLSCLDRGRLFDPFEAALTEIGSIAPGNARQVRDYVQALQARKEQLLPLAASLTQQSQAALDLFSRFDAERLAADLQTIVSRILDVAGKEDAGALAEILGRLKTAIAGMNLGIIEGGIEDARTKIDSVLAGIDLASLSQSVTEIGQRLSTTGQEVDRAMVQVSAFLSAQVTKLTSALGELDLSAVVDQVKNAFGTLHDGVQNLLKDAEAVCSQAGALTDSLSDELDGLDERIGLLRSAIEDLLGKVGDVLSSDSVKSALDTAQQGIDGIVQMLQNVDLSAVFDKAISQIADAQGKVAQIDVSQLNEVLRAALQAALMVIRRIDFQAIGSHLKDEFKSVGDAIDTPIAPLKSAYQKVLDGLTGFDPGAFVGQELKTQFDALVASLSRIEPGTILQPLKTLLDTLIKKLEVLKPDALLKPLCDLHAQLMAGLTALSPQSLIAPLNELLGKATTAIANLGIDDLTATFQKALDLVKGVIDSMGIGDLTVNTGLWKSLQDLPLQAAGMLSGLETRIDALIDALLASVGKIPMTEIQPALDKLRASIGELENIVRAPKIRADIRALVSTLGTQDFSGAMSELTHRWSDEKTRILAIAGSIDVDDTDLATLRQGLQDLSPVAVLADAAVLVNDIETSAKGALAALEQGCARLDAVLTAGHACLDSLLPEKDTIEGVMEMLRVTLDAQLGRPFKGVLQEARNRIEDLAKTLKSALDLALRFQAPFQALSVLPEGIRTMGQAIANARKKITGLNLGFLADEMEGVVAAARDQLQKADPGALSAQLAESYDLVVEALKGLYPEDDVKKLNDLYQDKIVKKIGNLDPAQVIGVPLSDAYHKLIDQAEELGVDKLFGALDAEKDDLCQQLNEGIDRTGQAFQQLLAALPA